MPTYKGSQPLRGSIHATSECGNAWRDDSQVTAPVALALNDIAVIMTIPAGVRLAGMRVKNGDFDTGTTLAFNLGYRSKHATPLLAANPTYFLSASTLLRAANATWQEVTFDEITFSEPVEIFATVTAAATGVSGTPTLSMQCVGNVVGVN